MAPESLRHGTVEVDDLKRLAHDAANRRDKSGLLGPCPLLSSRRSPKPALLNSSAPSFPPPLQQDSATAETFELTSEDANKLRSEGNCVKCGGHLDRDRVAVAETTFAAQETELVGSWAAVSKPYYLSKSNANSKDFVTLRVGKDATPIVAPKAILCMRSQYFHALFEGGFKEEQSRTTDLPNVDLECFSLVLRWFYTGSLLFSDNHDFITGKNDETFDEAVQMFLFADRYDTRELRLAIFDCFATSHFHPARQLDSAPIAKALSELHESSGLYKFFEDLIIYKWSPSTVEECTKLALYVPPTVLGKVLWHFHNGKPTEFTIFQMDMCQYHEHLSDTERRGCRKQIREKTERMKEASVAHALMYYYIGS